MQMNEQRRKKKDVAILPMSKLSLFRYENIYIIFIFDIDTSFTGALFINFFEPRTTLSYYAKSGKKSFPFLLSLL